MLICDMMVTSQYVFNDQVIFHLNSTTPYALTALNATNAGDYKQTKISCKQIWYWQIPVTCPTALILKKSMVTLLRQNTPFIKSKVNVY